MNLLEKIIFAFSTEATRPTDYGWFHLMFLGLVIVSTIILCVFFSKLKEKNFRIIVGVLWGVIVLFEIYKQLLFSYNPKTDLWDYQWYAFPFQFCSTPLYLFPFVAFMKDCKIRDGIILFLGTFSVFAGTCVMLAPGDVFSIDFLGIHIQTMLHHGTQVTLGIYIMVYNIKRLSKKNMLFAVVVFVVLLTIALLLNVLVHNFIVRDETFNMFFISPYFECSLPILSIVYQKVHYILFLMVYTFGFVLCGLIVYSAIFGIYKLVEKLKRKKLLD